MYIYTHTYPYMYIATLRSIHWGRFRSYVTFGCRVCGGGGWGSPISKIRSRRVGRKRGRSGRSTRGRRRRRLAPFWRRGRGGRGGRRWRSLDRRPSLVILLKFRTSAFLFLILFFRYTTRFVCVLGFTATAFNFIKLVNQFPLARRQFGRHFKKEVDDRVSIASARYFWRTLSFEDFDRIRWCCRGNCQQHRPLQNWYSHLAAQDTLLKTESHVRMHVVVDHSKHRVGFYIYRSKQMAWPPPPGARMALVWNPHFHSLPYTRRNLNNNFLALASNPLTLT